MSTQIILQGHVLDILKDIEDGFFDCIITSPPYWGLRDYGLEPMIWDEMDGCQHEWGNELVSGKNWKPGKTAQVGSTLRSSEYSPDSQGQFCSLCGAWRGSLGLEPTFQLYLDHLMQIMSECKRVLKKTGTMWVNIGDSYGTQGGQNEGFNERWHGKHYLSDKQGDTDRVRPKRHKSNIPAKSLIGIPERFAIHMTDDLHMIRRNTIIWLKRNAMPSSAKDRFSVNFEYIYFFTKQGDYWFEQQREESKWYNQCWSHKGSGGGTPYEENNPRKTCGLTKHEVATNRINASYGDPLHVKPIGEDGKRNMRTVWDIPTRPFKEAHFATFPPKLVEPMLKAGCPEFVCRKCGKAREKIYDRKRLTRPELPKNDPRYRPNTYDGAYGDINGKADAGYTEVRECGLTDCGCNAGFDGGWVLDPFAGAGTVGVVAKQQNKNFIGIELNPDYCHMAEKRIG